LDFLLPKDWDWFFTEPIGKRDELHLLFFSDINLLSLTITDGLAEHCDL